jgi:hypothetical protein
MRRAGLTLRNVPTGPRVVVVHGDDPDLIREDEVALRAVRTDDAAITARSDDGATRGWDRRRAWRPSPAHPAARF